MKKAERLLQLLIVLFCFVYLSVSFTSPASHAQVACNDQPPIRDNNHPEPYFQLKANMWLAGSQVAVTIYDSHETQSTQIEQGVNDWNSKTDCSAVHFTTAIDSSTDPPSSDPTSGKMWVVRASNSQAFPFTNTSNQMIAARINIQTPYTNTTPGALRGLARHETGHTFGLLNTTAAADCVMPTIER
jgi:hypothetical protein